MQELLRSSDVVLVNVVETLLTEARIPHFVADSHISALEGAIGAFPRRVLVPDEVLDRARRLMREAGLGHELRNSP